MMAEASGPDERLPWLEQTPRAATAPPAARQARAPLLVLLGLFMAGAIAVMAFLAGRSIAPVAPVAPPAPLVRVAPVPAPPIAQPAPPAAATPAPPVASPPRAARPTLTRKAQIRRSSAQRRAVARHRALVRQRAARNARYVSVHRNTRPARVVPRTVSSTYAVPQRRTNWPPQPFVGRGRVIQLGAYLTLAQADAGWWRLVRAYPYLGTLPRVVTVIGPSPGRPRYYRLRLAAGSNREARALCNNLHRIGRGCMVL